VYMNTHRTSQDDNTPDSIGFTRFGYFLQGDNFVSKKTHRLFSNEDERAAIGNFLESEEAKNPFGH
jgi:hypothetical protein